MNAPGSRTPRKGFPSHPTSPQDAAPAHQHKARPWTLKYHRELPHVALGFKHKQGLKVAELVPRMELAEGQVPPRAPGSEGSVRGCMQDSNTRELARATLGVPSPCPHGFLGSWEYCTPPTTTDHVLRKQGWSCRCGDRSPVPRTHVWFSSLGQSLGRAGGGSLAPCLGRGRKLSKAPGHTSLQQGRPAPPKQLHQGRWEVTKTTPAALGAEAQVCVCGGGGVRPSAPVTRLPGS